MVIMYRLKISHSLISINEYLGNNSKSCMTLNFLKAEYEISPPSRKIRKLL